MDAETDFDRYGKEGVSNEKMSGYPRPFGFCSNRVYFKHPKTVKPWGIVSNPLSGNNPHNRPNQVS